MSRPILLCAQQAIQAALQTLAPAGATQFLMWTVPDPGLTPAIRVLGAGAIQAATLLTTTFNNQMLLPMIHVPDQASADIEIARLDAFTLLQQINANPANFRADEHDGCVRDAEHPAVLLPADRRVPLLGRRPSDKRGARNRGGRSRQGARAAVP